MVVHLSLTPNVLLQGAGPVLKIRPLAPLANLGMGMENPVAHGDIHGELKPHKLRHKAYNYDKIHLQLMQLELTSFLYAMIFWVHSPK
jgi:hypothetical protein